MRVTLISAGSRGDIQPFAALGVALKQAGHRVRVAFPENFASFAAAQGLDFHPLYGDWQVLLRGAAGQQLMTEGTNLIRLVPSIREMVTPILERAAEDIYDAAQESDVLVSHSVVCLLSHAPAQKLNIPLFTAEPLPFIPSRAIPTPIFPLGNLGPLLNLGSSLAVRRLFWTVFQGDVNRLRAKIGLPRSNGSDYFRYVNRLPALEAFSAHVFPRPTDWGENIHVTGYWFLDEPGWQPPQPLLDFLSSGKPPIYVGFGSMSGDAPERTTKLILDAIACSGERTLISGGWGGITATDAPENVLFIDATPHGWLFPQVSAVVHHGGSGTTAAGLRAGVPCVIVPHLADQFFWGKRTYELGVGAKPIPRKKLTAENLATEIHAATDPAMCQRAAELGARIRAEDGVGTATRLIEQYLQ